MNGNDGRQSKSYQLCNLLGNFCCGPLCLLLLSMGNTSTSFTPDKPIMTLQTLYGQKQHQALISPGTFSTRLSNSFQQSVMTCRSLMACFFSSPALQCWTHLHKEEKTLHVAGLVAAMRFCFPQP
mmetsp:Transcript_46744/g.83712  ORF Transcript_46744/g.83712 Transcript_46744/m.83712 type:complete len:125 (-) Transcript_46744:321-695(-)